MSNGLGFWNCERGSGRGGSYGRPATRQEGVGLLQRSRACPGNDDIVARDRGGEFRGSGGTFSAADLRVVEVCFSDVTGFIDVTRETKGQVLREGKVYRRPEDIVQVKLRGRSVDHNLHVMLSLI